MCYLSKPQQYLLEVLRETGALRRSQATVLLQRQFDSSPHAIAVMLRQLRTIGQLREQDGVLTLAGRSASPSVLLAVDLALALFPKTAPILFRLYPPFVLAAYDEARNMTFRALAVPAGQEQACCLHAEQVMQSDPRVLLALLLEHRAQCKLICLPVSCLLAYPNADGELKITKYAKGAIQNDI